jgi:hypothetical protein
MLIKNAIILLLLLNLVGCGGGGGGSNVQPTTYPSITLTTSATSVAENSGTTITLTATASKIADEDIVITLASSGTADNGTDYSSLGGQTITISAGATTGTITGTPTDDSTYEGSETATISISTVVGASATENGTQSVLITITDDESAPTVSLATSASSVYDNGSSLTLTATSTQASQEAITVFIATSGTATEGTDYATISNITIAVGETTGTVTFNPTSDTVNEGSETATVSISSVSGADSTTSGTTSVTITINEYALRTGATFVEGTTDEQNTIKNRSTWTAIEAGGATHPYEQMGIHKVQSFTDGTNNLTGVGQTIHIADWYCDTTHDIYDNKTITNLDNGDAGESTFGAATSSNNHCQGVAMFAAGDIGARSGVAPDAELVLSSIPDFEGSNEGDDYARDLDAARVLGAIASNQSWGYSSGGTSYSLSEFNAAIAGSGQSNAEGLANVMHNSPSGQALTDVNTYITALNNFESSGVVVWSAGNDSGEADAGVMAALPELFPSLGEAWIVANMVQYTGDSDLSNATSSEFTLRGNKCGSTKEYCLSVDGWGAYQATYVDNGVSKYNTTGSAGSSWSAPMVSGGVALMSQAFPNHTPEQLVDRILASANNVWFTPEGNTTFTTHGNSITHGYHSTWGQGVPDFYAALSPITTSANPAMALYSGSSIQEDVNSDSSVSLASSSITPSASFGDAIYQGLSGEVGYAYDALSGGFKYDMTTRVDMSNNDAPTISLSSEMAKLDSLLAANNSSWKNNFSQVLSQLSKTDKLETSLTVGASSLPVQSFFGSNFDSSVSLNDYETPYLESGEGGIGLGATYQLGNSRLLVGMTNPINQNDDNTIGLRKSLVASLEYGNPSATAVTVMAGATQDKDSLLGSTGNSAYGLSGAKSNTIFSAFKAQTQLGKDLSLTGIATLASTNMSKPDASFINSANNVKSTSVSLIANKRNVFGDDSMSFFVSQPNRVDDGSMSIRLSNLADSNGNLSYRNKDINLEPTARQLDYGLSYRKDLDKDISFSIKHMMTENLNHKQDSQTVSSSFIGAKYKDLKVGLATNPGEDSNSAEIAYDYKF